MTKAGQTVNASPRNFVEKKGCPQKGYRLESNYGT